MQCQTRNLFREAHSAISNWCVRFALILVFPIKHSYSFVHLTCVRLLLQQEPTWALGGGGAMSVIFGSQVS